MIVITNLINTNILALLLAKSISDIINYINLKLLEVLQTCLGIFDIVEFTVS